jgi:hypothetical protein
MLRKIWYIFLYSAWFSYPGYAWAATGTLQYTCAGFTMEYIPAHTTQSSQVEYWYLDTMIARISSRVQDERIVAVYTLRLHGTNTVLEGGPPNSLEDLLLIGLELQSKRLRAIQEATFLDMATIAACEKIMYTERIPAFLRPVTFGPQ